MPIQRPETRDGTLLYENACHTSWFSLEAGAKDVMSALPGRNSPSRQDRRPVEMSGHTESDRPVYDGAFCGGSILRGDGITFLE